ncbi:hypothetical protein ACLMAB_18145 [Brevibacillus laterosporus]
MAPGKTVQVWSGWANGKNSSITPRIQVVSDVRGRASLSPQFLLELSIGAGTQAVPTAEIWDLRSYRSLVKFRPF